MNTSQTVNVDAKLVVELVTLWRIYQANNPASIATTQSFTGFMYWLEQQYWQGSRNLTTGGKDE